MVHVRVLGGFPVRDTILSVASRQGLLIHIQRAPAQFFWPQISSLATLVQIQTEFSNTLIVQFL